MNPSSDETKVGLVHGGSQTFERSLSVRVAIIKKMKMERGN